MLQGMRMMMIRMISLVKLVDGIWRRWLFPSGVCGWLATAHSYWRGAVSNLTHWNPQMPTLTASCDENQFTGKINPFWIVGELSSLAWSCCFGFSHPCTVVGWLDSLWSVLKYVVTNLPQARSRWAYFPCSWKAEGTRWRWHHRAGLF